MCSPSSALATHNQTSVCLYKVVDPYSLSTRQSLTLTGPSKSLLVFSSFDCFQIIIQNSGATLEFNLVVNLHQAVLTSSFSSYSSSLFQSLEPLGHGEIKDSDATLLRTWSISCVQCGLNVKTTVISVLDFYGMHFFLLHLVQQ